MKNRIRQNVINGLSIVLLLTSIPSIGGCKSNDSAMPKSSQIVDIDPQQPAEKKKLSVYVGEVFTVRIRSTSGTGYNWNIAGGVNDAGVISLVTRRVEKDPKAAPGAPVWEVFDLKARKSGQSTVEFVYERPWERNVPPAKRVMLTVDVGY